METVVTPREKRALAPGAANIRRCHVCRALYKEYDFVRVGRSTRCPACAELVKTLKRGDAEAGKREA